MGVPIDQTGNDGPVVGIDDLGLRADGVFGVLAHIGDPFALNGDGLILQQFTRVDINNFGIYNGQVSFFLTKGNFHKLTGFLGSFWFQYSANCHFGVISFF